MKEDTEPLDTNSMSVVPPETGVIPVIPPADRQAPLPVKVKIPEQIKVMLIASFLIALGFGLIAPVLPRYATTFGVGTAVAGVVISIFATTRLLFAPTSGKLIEKFTERPIYIAGLLIVALGSLGTAFSPNIWVLLFFRAFGGIGSVMFTVSAMALLVRLAPPTIRGRVSGYYATSFLMGNILGPVAGALAAPLGMRLPFIFYSLMLFIASGFIYFKLKDTGMTTTMLRAQSNPPLTFKQALGFSNYRSALFGNFAIGWAAFGIRVSLVPLAALAVVTLMYGENGNLDNQAAMLAGVSMATYAAGNALSQNIAGRYSDRGARRPYIFAGFLVAGAATVFFGLAPNALWFIALSVLTGIGTGILAPAMQASLADIIGNKRSGGAALANAQMFADVGQIIGPILAGAIADSLGFGWAFGVSGALMIIAAFVWSPLRKPTFPVHLADEGYTGR
ncbi:MFS transporter [Rothia sp. ZJ932]|uniref:MFS transporter n=1 Tax=Rothia sp. ZJ932 TaxID=2810516 RepID=UPI001F07CD74|nr:MFS transporter [Rothia sp. ZJ932]